VAASRELQCPLLASVLRLRADLQQLGCDGLHTLRP
jgi:hypothetical protein